MNKTKFVNVFSMFWLKLKSLISFVLKHSAVIALILMAYTIYSSNNNTKNLISKINEQIVANSNNTRDLISKMNDQIITLKSIETQKRKRYIDLLITEIGVNMERIEKYNDLKKTEWVDENPDTVPNTIFSINGFDAVLNNMAVTHETLVRNIAIVRSRFIDLNRTINSMQTESTEGIKRKLEHLFNRMNDKTFHKDCKKFEVDLTEYSRLLE